MLAKEFDINKEFDTINKVCFNGKLVKPKLVFKDNLNEEPFYKLDQGLFVYNIDYRYKKQLLFVRHYRTRTFKRHLSVLFHEMMHLYGWQRKKNSKLYLKEFKIYGQKLVDHYKMPLSIWWHR